MTIPSDPIPYSLIPYSLIPTIYSSPTALAMRTPDHSTTYNY